MGVSCGGPTISIRPIIPKSIGRARFHARADSGLATNVTRQTVSYGKGRYVIAGSDHIAFSTDLQAWDVRNFASAPRAITYVDGWFVSSDFRISRDGVAWQATPNSFPKFYLLDSIAIVGDTVVGTAGLELWRCKLSLPKPRGLSLFRESGVEVTTDPLSRYRLWQSPDLVGWSPVGGWRDGTGDYLLWPVDFLTPTGFWNVEIETVNAP